LKASLFRAGEEVRGPNSKHVEQLVHNRRSKNTVFSVAINACDLMQMGLSETNVKKKVRQLL